MTQSPNILKILQSAPGTNTESFIRKKTASKDWAMYAMICSEKQYTEEACKELKGTPRTLCFRRTVRLVTGGAPFLIVDNPNLNLSDYIGYVQLGEAYGYEVEIVCLIDETKNAIDIEALKSQNHVNRTMEKV